MTQFFNVHPETPQQRLIKQAAQVLLDGDLVVYPTDSYYAIGFLPNNMDSLKRTRQLRGLGKQHLFTLMCQNLKQLGDYGVIDTAAFRVIKKRTPGAYTFVLQATSKLARHLCHPRRKTMAFRIPDYSITQALLEEVGEPIVTTTLRLAGDNEPLAHEDLRERLNKKVELVLDGGPCPMSPTTMIDFSETPPRLLRQGGGVIGEEDML